MKFFIDTANVEDIRKANDMGVICGVTTNPSLIALLFSKRGIKPDQIEAFLIRCLYSDKLNLRS